MDILQWINRLQGEENLEKRPSISQTFALYYGHQHYFPCNVVWWIRNLNVWKLFMNQDQIRKKDKITRRDVCECTCDTHVLVRWLHQNWPKAESCLTVNQSCHAILTTQKLHGILLSLWLSLYIKIIHNMTRYRRYWQFAPVVGCFNGEKRKLRSTAEPK